VTDLTLITRFLEAHPRLVVVTGAGISAASGIPTYRDAAGRWLRAQPIQHREFVTDERQRKRYWARSISGWPAVRDARPNRAHIAFSELERQGRVELLITQNVDRLHQRAGSRKVTDLHGRLDQVQCLGCACRYSRESIQQRLLGDNPHIQPGARTTLPDGDADVACHLLDGLKVPGCKNCGGILKPDVVFFGDNVPSQTVERCMAALERADALLAAGSSLQVWSGFRFCKRAAELGRPLMIINPGQTRADPLATVKLHAECGPLLHDAAAILQNRRGAALPG
jgi:NAD-dependent SIR2 family protein deacetylase